MPDAPRSPQPRLRPARAGDLEPVRVLLTAASLPPDGLEDQFGPGYVVAEVGEAAAGAPAAVVGAAGVEVHGDAGLLRSVVVAAPLQGTGLGRALVTDRLAWARRERLSTLFLLTTTAADFFTHLGFARVAREEAPEAIRASREFASVCPASAIVMRLDVGAAE